MSLVRYIKKILLSIFSYLPSVVKISVYRLLGAQIGKTVELGLGSYIVPFDGDFKRIRIGDRVIIEDGVHILAKNLVIGEQSQIKSSTRIWGQSTFLLGRGCYIDQDCRFDLRRDLSLGNDVAVGGGSWFYTHMVFHSILNGAPFTFGAIVIDDRAYLGANTFVLPGVTIGRDAMVGARTVVTRDVHPDTVVVGNPARVIGLTSERKKNLDITEKKILVADILDYFMDVYDRTVQSVNRDEDNGRLFVYGGHLVYYPPLFRNAEQIIHVASRFHQKPAVVISFGIPDAVKEYCTGQAIVWYDLESGRRSPSSNATGNKIEQFFGEYGIRFSY